MESAVHCPETGENTERIAGASPLEAGNRVEATEPADQYARSLVDHAIGLREGQPLYIRGLIAHRDLALRVGEVAYDRGASVRYRLVDSEQLAQLVRRGTPGEIQRILQEEEAWYSEILQNEGAVIRLTDGLDSESLKSLHRTSPENYDMLVRGKSKIMFDFQTEATKRRTMPITVATSPTESWAHRIFPVYNSKDALDRLWRLLLVVARLSNGERELECHIQRLKARTKILNDLEIVELHITGNGNDCHLGIPSQARWCNATQETSAGQIFIENFPSEEVFTAPYRTLTEGRLVASNSLKVMAMDVQDLVLEFRKGRVVELEARAGADEITRWLATDDGAKYLGEIGLVDSNSPIAKTKLNFGNIYIDENAASHIALGQAYECCVRGGEDMSRDELARLGCNHSGIHLDIVFGSPDVSITATKSREGEVALIEGGYWTERFREGLDIEPNG